MAKSPEEMLASMITNLKEKTGKSLEQWVALARKSGAAKHGEVVNHLKAEHGLGHGYANLVAREALQGSAPPAGGADLVAIQYAGPKADLKPVYDRILERVAAFGVDVEIAPKKTYVSLRRSKQFAMLQPSTRTRLDVGINLRGVPAKGRLEAAGSFNAMVTHRVRVSALDQVDKELVGWLRRAYEAS